MSLTVERPDEDGLRVERLQWVEISGRLYRFTAWTARADWAKAEEMLDRVVDSFRVVTSAERRAWMAAVRLRFHVVEVSEVEAK